MQAAGGRAGAPAASGAACLPCCTAPTAPAPLLSALSSAPQVVPRVCIFGGKAASAYYMAKKIVALLVAISETVRAAVWLKGQCRSRAHHAGAQRN